MFSLLNNPQLIILLMEIPLGLAHDLNRFWSHAKIKASRPIRLH